MSFKLTRVENWNGELCVLTTLAAITGETTFEMALEMEDVTGKPADIHGKYDINDMLSVIKQELAGRYRDIYPDLANEAISKRPTIGQYIKAHPKNDLELVFCDAIPIEGERPFDTHIFARDGTGVVDNNYEDGEVHEYPDDPTPGLENFRVKRVFRVWR
jgi:hypothetical protein